MCKDDYGNPAVDAALDRLVAGIDAIPRYDFKSIEEFANMPYRTVRTCEVIIADDPDTLIEAMVDSLAGQIKQVSEGGFKIV